MAQRFDSKVALITGAASGIGRATALRLASEGAQVVGLDVNADGLAETERLAKEAGTPVATRVTDVTSIPDCRAAVAEAVEAHGKLDVLGNIAGIARGEHMLEVDEKAYRQMFAVNADGYFFLAQAAIPHLLHEGGNIVNIASNAGLMGGAYTVVYCMTKGVVVQLTRALAMEFIKTPLRVNAIAPGGVLTGITANYTMPPDVDFDLIKPYMGIRPMTTPEGIAAMFAWVASDEAANVHGAILCNDGGLTAG